MAQIFKSSAEESTVVVKKRRARKLRPWPSNLKKLSKESKHAYTVFKQDGGMKDETNKLWMNCKMAKKRLRQAQRQLEANNRYKLYYEIMDSYSSNQKLFYKLINIQRSGKTKKLAKLIIDDRHLESSDEVRNGWASYFEKLSTSSANPSFCEYQRQLVQYNINNILKLQNVKKLGVQYATLDEISEAIGKMKNGKSPDELNLMSEHLKFGGQIVPVVLKALFDRILQERDIPEIFKSGIITPIHKSHGKPLQDPNSYRRITLCSIMGKVFETIHLAKI